MLINSKQIPVILIAILRLLINFKLKLADLFGNHRKNIPFNKDKIPKIVIKEDKVSLKLEKDKNIAPVKVAI